MGDPFNVFGRASDAGSTDGGSERRQPALSSHPRRSDDTGSNSRMPAELSSTPFNRQQLMPTPSPNSTSSKRLKEPHRLLDRSGRAERKERRIKEADMKQALRAELDAATAPIKYESGAPRTVEGGAFALHTKQDLIAVGFTPGQADGVLAGRKVADEANAPSSRFHSPLQPFRPRKPEDAAAYVPGVTRLSPPARIPSVQPPAVIPLLPPSVAHADGSDGAAAEAAAAAAAAAAALATALASGAGAKGSKAKQPLALKGAQGWLSRVVTAQQQLPPLDCTPRSTAHLIGMELYRRELSAIEMVRVLNSRTRSAM